MWQLAGVALDEELTGASAGEYLAVVARRRARALPSNREDGEGQRLAEADREIADQWLELIAKRYRGPERLVPRVIASDHRRQPRRALPVGVG